MPLSKNQSLCRSLGLSLPIFQGGMAWASDAVLAAAVSREGALGIIGCGGRDLAWVKSQIKLTKQLTSSPVALNFPLEGMSHELIEMAILEAINAHIRLFTVSGSHLYTKLIQRFQPDATIIPLVGTVMQAKLAERCGAKVIICEGQESGGSVGKSSLFSLLPQVVDAVSLPVVAAGGITDGRGIDAALSLGASGVQLGTRFLASTECPIDIDYKEKIVKARDTDTNIVFKKLGRPARVIKNRFCSKYLSMEEGQTDQETLFSFSLGKLKQAAEGDVINGAVMAGEGSGMIKEVIPAQEIINRLLKDSCLISKPIAFDEKISDVLDHEHPILMVEKIVQIKPGEFCEATTKISEDLWFFKCHYPDHPIMPGSMLIELMSQVLTIATKSAPSKVEAAARLVVSRIDKIKFIRPVYPEMKIVIQAKVVSERHPFVLGVVSCKLNDKLICSCEMTLMSTTPGSKVN
jgi:enoyl-[acyl-carrier protein] reductase II